MNPTESYHQLCYWTLTLGDDQFVHQHVVDAWAAQNVQVDDKPIRAVFPLVGLYLHLERGQTGRQVQKAHMRMASRRRSWPQLVLPADRGEVTVAAVVVVEPGPLRVQALDRWCESVWQAYRESRQVIVDIAAECDVG